MQTPETPGPTDEGLEKHHGRRRGNNLAWAVVLIVIGGVFLVRNLLGLTGNFNWWAVFILLPAAGSFSGMIASIQRTGHFGAAARSSLGSGLILLTLAMMFLFNMDWAVWWPLMIIMPGVSAILGGLPDASLRPEDVAGGFLNLSVWVGLSAVLLGAGFLLENLHILDPAALLPVHWRWWGAVIILPGLGALVNGLMLRDGETTGRRFSSAALILIGLLACVVGGLAFFGLNWTLLAPLAIIAAGLGFLFSLIGKKPTD